MLPIIKYTPEYALASYYRSQYELAVLGHLGIILEIPAGLQLPATVRAMVDSVIVLTYISLSPKS